MSITVADCLNLPSLRMGKVVAGKCGVNRIVNNVSVLEVIDESTFEIGKAVTSGDILLTSFYKIKDNPKEQCKYLEYTYSTGDACIILYYVGVFIKELHPSVLETADRLNFPIIVMPENRMDFFYTEVISDVYEALFRDRSSNNDFVENITSLVSRLPENMRNMTNLLSIIGSNLKVTLLLSDIATNNVYMTKWPVSNDISDRDITSLYEEASVKEEYCVESSRCGVPLQIFRLPFTAFEYRNFFIYAADEFGTLTLDDMFKVLELLQIFSKLWDLDSNSILENALIPAIIEGDDTKTRSLALKLNIDIDSINTMMIIRPDFSVKGAKEQLHIKRDMIKAIKNCSEDMKKNTIIDAYGLYIIGFTMLSSAKSSDSDYIEELISNLNDISADYTISVFLNDDNVEDVRKTYLLYSENICHVLKIFPNKKEFSYGDCLFAKRCFDISNEKNDEYRICKNVLKPLLNASDSQELLETLAVYHLDTECQVKKTAVSLFLHRNTVQYRLNKIKEITNFKTDHILDSYIMHTAIACHRLLEASD